MTMHLTKSLLKHRFPHPVWPNHKIVFSYKYSALTSILMYRIQHYGSLSAPSARGRSGPSDSESVLQIFGARRLGVPIGMLQLLEPHKPPSLPVHVVSRVLSSCGRADGGLG